MSLFDRAVAEGVIVFEQDRKYIRYLHAGKRYRFTDPEESIRADAYLQLIYNYSYPSDHISLEVTVPRRTPSDLADIVVFDSSQKVTPIIVVEAKKSGISNAEFGQAIEQGFGNANSLRAKYLWIASGDRDDYYNVADSASMERVENRIADLPRSGRDELSHAKFYKGKINELGDPAFDIHTVNDSELTAIFRSAHNALWAGGKRSSEMAFDELDKLIFCKIWDEKKPRKRGVPYDFQNFTQESAAVLADRIGRIYQEGQARSPEVFDEDIRLEPEELKTVVGYLAPVNLGHTDLDSKGKAFETFMDSFFRGKFGQFFTPRQVVKFITDVLPIEHTSVVLDPACGSGGFLLYALEKVRTEASEYYDKESREHYRHWHDFAERQLFGIEINMPIARTAKMNMIIHDDGHTNVIAHDGLETLEKLRGYAQRNGSTYPNRFGRNQIDIIPTNPPFGSTIKKAERGYMGDFDLGQSGVDWITALQTNRTTLKVRDSQKSEILFIEQCYNLLKVDGWMGMVVPDGILTNSSLQYVRDWIEEHFRIVAVVSLPQTTFTKTGAGVKSSVLFVRKYSDARVAEIQAIKARVQGEIFAEEVYGSRLAFLGAEHKRLVKEGDDTIQRINADAGASIAGHRNQGTLDRATKRVIESAARGSVKAHKTTGDYKAWKKALDREWRDKINTLKEAMGAALAERVRAEVTNYPIFMAIAEDIGYDATGRDTGNNELGAISAELKRFITAIQEGTDANFL